ncbi:hypothetical protein IJF81_03280 [bacterium]|nr:hypothetical protein [bacterium]
MSFTKVYKNGSFCDESGIFGFLKRKMQYFYNYIIHLNNIMQYVKMTIYEDFKMTG